MSTILVVLFCHTGIDGYCLAETIPLRLTTYTECMAQGQAYVSLPQMETVTGPQWEVRGYSCKEVPA